MVARDLLSYSTGIVREPSRIKIFLEYSGGYFRVVERKVLETIDAKFRVRVEQSFPEGSRIFSKWKHTVISKNISMIDE